MQLTINCKMYGVQKHHGLVLQHTGVISSIVLGHAGRVNSLIGTFRIQDQLREGCRPRIWLTIFIPTKKKNMFHYLYVKFFYKQVFTELNRFCWSCCSNWCERMFLSERLIGHQRVVLKGQHCLRAVQTCVSTKHRRQKQQSPATAVETAAAAAAIIWLVLTVRDVTRVYWIVYFIYQIVCTTASQPFLLF